MAARPRVALSENALLLEQCDTAPLGSRWDLPRRSIEGRVIEERDDLVVVCCEGQAALGASLAWHDLTALRERWREGHVALSADAAAVVRSIGSGSTARVLARAGTARERGARTAGPGAGEPFAGSISIASCEGQGAIELSPSLRMLAVRTPTLPPATHTNLFVVGSRDAVLIEPATPYADELDRIAEWTGALEAEGVVVKAILATHHHVDHIGGARALQSLLGVPIVAHGETDVRMPVGVRADRRLADGERIELEGPEPITLRAVLTPGHAPGHLCFFEERSRVLVAGDMVAGVGTILVEPGDGDMALYLESLRRMIAVDPSALAPAHGGALRPPRLVLERYLEHRLARERRVLEALQRFGQAASAGDLLPDAYADAPRAVWPLAALSTEAHLLKLERDGAAHRTAAGWLPTAR